MPQAQGMALADRVDTGVLLVLVDVLESLLFARLLEVRLEARFGIEVVLDGLLARAGDEEDVLDSGVRCFAHDVLDRGTINDG